MDQPTDQKAHLDLLAYAKDLLERMRSEQYEPTEHGLGKTQGVAFRAFREAERLDNAGLIPIFWDLLRDTKDKFERGHIYFCLSHVAAAVQNQDVAIILVEHGPREKDRWVRHCLLEALGRVPTAKHLHKVLDYVESQLQVKNSLVRQTAMLSLAQIADPRSARLLAECIERTTDKYDLSYALHGLYKQGDASYFDLIKPLLYHSDQDVMSAATACTAKWLQSQAVPLLIELLASRRLCKYECMYSLLELADGRALEAVIKRTCYLLQHPHKRLYSPCSEVALGLKYLSQYADQPQASQVLEMACQRWSSFNDYDREWLKQEVQQFADLP